MSKSIQAAFLLSVLALGACQQQQEEEVIMVEPEPITAEPVSTKY
jgi:hypothetical protein